MYNNIYSNKFTFNFLYYLKKNILTKIYIKVIKN